MLTRPILYRQPPKHKHNGFFHPILDGVNVFPFQMINSEAPPFSTLSEKTEDVLFEVKSLPINILIEEDFTI